MAGRLFELDFADLEGPPQAFGKGIAKIRVGEGFLDLQIQVKKFCRPSDNKWNGILVGHPMINEMGFGGAPVLRVFGEESVEIWYPLPPH